MQVRGPPTVQGGLGFWIVPSLIDYALTGQLPDQRMALGIACAWMFINVHHAQPR